MSIQSIGEISVQSIEDCYRVADASENDAERRTKMLCSREYVEGWCDGRETQ